MSRYVGKRKMDIGIFGCSFTEGGEVTKDNNNWVNELGKLEPSWKIRNYASGGSSLAYSIWNWNKFIEENPNSFTVFQITLPWRYTVIGDYDPERYMVSTHQLNVKEISRHKDIPITLANLNNIKKSPISKFAKQYWQNHSNLEMIQYKIACEYIRNKADICFRHREGNDDILSMEGVLGKRQYALYVADKGSHFNLKGMQWQAEFIRQMILDKQK